MSEHDQGLVVEVLGRALDSDAWIEIGAAFAAYFVLSFLWWGPLFGRLWGREMGMDMQTRPDGRTMGKALALQAVGSFLMAYVLWHVMMAFTVDVASGATTNPSASLAIQGAFYVWLGFIVPVQLGRVAWEKASWTLFGINSGGQLVGLAAMGLVFALL